MCPGPVLKPNPYMCIFLSLPSPYCFLCRMRHTFASRQIFFTEKLPKYLVGLEVHYAPRYHAKIVSKMPRAMETSTARCYFVVVISPGRCKRNARDRRLAQWQRHEFAESASLKLCTFRLVKICMSTTWLLLAVYATHWIRFLHGLMDSKLKTHPMSIVAAGSRARLLALMPSFKLFKIPIAVDHAFT